MTQDSLALLPEATLERYEKLAGELVAACTSGGGALHAWAEGLVREIAGRVSSPSARDVPRRIGQVEDLARRRLLPGTGGQQCALADARLVLATAHGFESWRDFAEHVAALARKTSDIAMFEAAADGIVSGDLPVLTRLLRERPDLVRVRSTREHHATLFHYCSANGVEGFRQRTPANAVAVVTALLDAGAEVDATANVYGDRWTTLGLVATSSPPRDAGVQNELIETLLDHGAALDVTPGGIGLVNSALANGCRQAAEVLAQRGAPVDIAAAAGLGRLDLVKAFWANGGRPTDQQIAWAFKWACIFGQTDVARFLLDNGFDMSTQARDSQTGLHWAVNQRQFDIVRLLLARQAPLDRRNEHGETALDHALWSAARRSDPEKDVQMIEALIAAGAQPPARHPPINERIDQLLERHGSHADEALSWRK